MGAILSTIGLGAVNTASSVYNTERQLSAQKENQREQNAWQSGENEKDRLWQQQQWAEQFNQENDEWQRRFDLQNEYNDPSAVVQRLRGAGINPAAAMGQLTGSGGLAAAGGSSNPVSPGPMPTHQVSAMGISPVGSIPDISGVLSGISNIMNAKTNAARLGLDAEKQEAMLPVEVQNLLQDVAGKKLVNEYQQIINDVQSIYGKDKAGAEVQHLLSSAAANWAKEDYERAATEVQKAVAQFTSDNNARENAKFPQVLANLKAMHSEILASANKQNADARLSREQSISVAALRDGQIRGQNLANTISEAKAVISNLDAQSAQAVQFDKIDALLSAYEREGWITYEQKQKAVTAAKVNKWYDVTKVLDSAESASRTVKNVTSSLSIGHWLLGD